MGNRSGELVVKINVEGPTTIEKLETIIKKISEIKICKKFDLVLC